MEESPLPDFMNPIECGAIIVLDRKWSGATSVFALPTGAQVPAHTLEWLMAYSREQSIPLIFYENLLRGGKFLGMKQFGYGPPAFVEAVKNALKPEDIFML